MTPRTPLADPGVQTTLSNFVRLPFETVRGTIGWPDDRIQELIDQVRLSTLVGTFKRAARLCAAFQLACAVGST